MKKFISAVLSASLAVSSMGTLFASAAEIYGDGSDIVVFGDSIAEGYDLASTEYNYGQIVADYIGGTVSNYAKAGDETADTITKIASANDLKDAEVVIISSGANDMIHYAVDNLLKFFAQNNLLNDGYTTDNIPENPTFDQMLNMVDMTAVKEFIGKSINTTKIAMRLEMLEAHIITGAADKGYENYDHVIEAQIVPNIEKMVSDIRAVNPNARIILQTVYNPIQLEESYLNGTIPSSYKQFFSLLEPKFTNIVNAYNEKINSIEGVEIADVYTSFASKNEAEFNTWYFTGIQENDIKDFNIHPNQAGHIAIAANILNVLGEKNEDGGLLNLTYEMLAKKDSYPAYALSEYNNVAGTYILGNTNGDTLIDANDATVILAEYSATSTGGTGVLSENEKKAADIDADGKIGSADASLILAYYSYTSTGGTASFKNYLANN